LSTAVWIVLIVVVAGVGSEVIEHILKWRLKVHELKVQEMKLRMEDRLKSDELNAKLLHMDDLGLSPTELASLAENVRQLRDEVAQLRQEITSRGIGQGNP
jgi:hypothetical protein